VNEIGIVIPTRNVNTMVSDILNGIEAMLEKYISKVVIIDNASTDNTIAEIIESQTFKKYPDKFHIERNIIDMGYSYSLKRGIEYFFNDSKTKYIGVLHSDDQFQSQQVIQHYVNNIPIQPKSVFIVTRTPDPKANFNYRQLIRNTANKGLTLVANWATNKSTFDINTPFFLINKNEISFIYENYGLSNDIFFHPRLNLLFNSLYTCRFSDCDWKRAKRTTKIPITKMGIQLIILIIKFGVCYRFLRIDFSNSYKISQGAAINVKN
jgi:glycosyltransferase involved in cell wall biosynthesis